MNPHASASDQYLTNLVMGASPEQLMVLLLGGAQRFLGQAIAAIHAKDVPTRSRHISRVMAIIEEMTVRLDFEGGGELVDNLVRLYDWWTREALDASLADEVPRLESISRQMGQLKGVWEQVHQRQAASAHAGAHMVQGLVG